MHGFSFISSPSQKRVKTSMQMLVHNLILKLRNHFVDINKMVLHRSVIHKFSTERSGSFWETPQTLGTNYLDFALATLSTK
jgi:hypothetical protein